MCDYNDYKEIERTITDNDLSFQKIDGDDMEDPYFHLPEIIDGDTDLYFFIDYWNIDFIIYRAKMSDIHTFLGDCETLIDEYYLITPDFTELYGITDHDDLLHIDVRQNEMRSHTSISE